MFKKLLLFSTMAIIGGCETINQANQCDPDKNYINYNDIAMEKYQNEREKGLIKSIYFYNKNPKKCEDDRCVYFDNNTFDFIERNFDDSLRKGVYKITISFDKKDSECMKENPYNNNKEYCFKATKNKNNIIESSYVRSTYIENGVAYIKFDNVKEGVLIYEKSYQIFRTGAIGGPGFGECKIIKTGKQNFNEITFNRK